MYDIDIVTVEGAGLKGHQRCNRLPGFVVRSIHRYGWLRCWENKGRVRNRMSPARGDEERITEEKTEIILVTGYIDLACSEFPDSRMSSSASCS